MQVVPTFTESGGHRSAAPAGTAVTRQRAVQPTTVQLRTPFMVSPVPVLPIPLADRASAAERTATVATVSRALFARGSGAGYLAHRNPRAEFEVGGSKTDCSAKTPARVPSAQ